MNDIVLSSLLNLFALFGTHRGVEKERSKAILSTYLSHHFGVKNVDSYLRLYDDLRDFYDDSPEIDKATILVGICSKLQGRISVEEQTLMLLRLMEISAQTGQETELQGFRLIAEQFCISDETFGQLADFACGTDCVTVEYAGGVIKAVYLLQFNKLLFTYEGDSEVLMNDVPVVKNVFQVWQRSGVLKSRHDKALYYYQVMSHFDNGLSGQNEIKLRGSNVNFRFEQGGDNGMHNFTFNLYSGELVAIMGGSGVGKSTLLSLLNGTLVPQEGEITINGHAITEPEAKALIGFVPQDDLLIEELTVYENLWFTARLCFDGLTDAEIDRKVISVLEDLGLDAAKDLKVGSPIKKYISGGQRKRLNIALELIRQPAILFLDEPTSGLSSADTETVVNLLKEQALKGKLIVANIHQPSSDVFKLFDRLWILDKGGYPIYDGNPIEAVTYFKNAANYADADVSTCPVCGNVNPEIILNIIDEKALSSTGELTNIRKKTPQQWHEMYLETVTPDKGAKVEPLQSTNQQKPGRLRQTAIFLARTLKAKATNLQYILITLLEAPLLALICALLTRYAPAGEEYCVMNNRNMVSYYFMAVIVAIFLGMSGSAEEIIRERALLKREKFIALSYKSYIWSKIIYMAGVSAVQTLLFIVVGNMIMGISGMFLTWWLILFVSALLAGLMGLLLSQCMNSVVSIYITIPLLLIPQILLCGLVVKFSDLTPHSKTGNVPILGDVIPSRWAFEALAVSSYTDNAYEAPFFAEDKQRYETLFYRSAYLREVKSQLESMKTYGDDRMAVIRNSLPVLAEKADITPYQGDYSYGSLKEWLDVADKALNRISNAATLRLDRRVGDMRRMMGKDAVTQLKRRNYNLQLESQVLNSAEPDLVKVVDDVLVPNAGFVFLSPLSHNGCAPFYSGEKVLGTWHVPTLWYNIAVLLVMSMVLTILLLNNTINKIFKKQ